VSYLLHAERQQFLREVGLHTQKAIEAKGAKLHYLPQYSPDLNPIEMPFSKLKADLRKAGERTVPRLCRRIGWFARRLSASEALNYFRHAGYA
jgi:transposase